MICLSCPPALRDIFHTPMARYSLFVLKVPLNNSKPNQTLWSTLTRDTCPDVLNQHDPRRASVHSHQLY